MVPASDDSDKTPSVMTPSVMTPDEQQMALHLLDALTNDALDQQAYDDACNFLEGFARKTWTRA